VDVEMSNISQIEAKPIITCDNTENTICTQEIDKTIVINSIDKPG